MWEKREIAPRYTRAIKSPFGATPPCPFEDAGNGRERET